MRSKLDIYVFIREETPNTDVIVFGLTQQETEWTIYRTRCKQTNHYTTEAEYFARQQ